MHVHLHKERAQVTFYYPDFELVNSEIMCRLLRLPLHIHVTITTDIFCFEIRKYVFADPSKQPGLMWRMSSGLYNTASGAVGMSVGVGVGSIKWVAEKSYNVGTAVKSKMPSVPKLRKKAKDE
jgi:hypothetical protein